MPMPPRAHQSQRRRCPRRPYAPPASSSSSSSRLPRTAPIIGLGCSSFSDFFVAPDETTKEFDEGGDAIRRPTVDAIRKSDPRVRIWIETVRRAVLDYGIDLLDTAPWYGHGVSEIVVGYALEELLLPEEEEEEEANEGGGDDDVAEDEGDDGRRRRRRVHRSSLTINTKVGRYESDPSEMFDFSYDRTIRSVDLSLRRLKCRYVDVMQIHDPEFAPSIDAVLNECVPALLECRRTGKVRALGITGYPLEVQHEILVRAGKEFGGAGATVFDQSLSYCHCNLHDCSLFGPPGGSADVTGGDDVGNGTDEAESENSRSSSSFAEYCASNNVALLAAAPLSMGLLTKSGPPGWHPAPTELKHACRTAAKICEERDVDLSALSTIFALSRSTIPCTIIGMKDPSEVDKAMEAAMRFQDEVRVESCGDGGGNDDELLDRVLTNPEREVLKLLRDESKGPFADVKRNGAYHWDWKVLADEHWASVPGGREEGEARMKRRGAEEGRVD